MHGKWTDCFAMENPFFKKRWPKRNAPANPPATQYSDFSYKKI